MRELASQPLFLKPTFWALALLGVIVCTVGLFRLGRGTLGRAYRRWSRRTTLKLVRRYRVRLNRFQLARRWLVKQRLMEDPVIQAAAAKAASDRAISPSQALDEVGTYLDEIVPAFNAISYYQWGHWAARFCLRVLYRVVVLNIPDNRRASDDERVVYVMNHRSNADYVLVAFALLERVSISYAVGEWARVWPLEFIFKSFGSYFVRRNFRDPLYHAVLERYVQQLAQEAVTQGIFLEGGLSRSGSLRQPKLGLLDYLCGVLRDDDFSGDLVFVPVGINYDRVLEDRALLREADPDAPRHSRTRRLVDTFRYALKGAWRSARGRRAHYGVAAVQFGEPLSLRSFVGGAHTSDPDASQRLLEPSFEHRRPGLERLAAELMRRIGDVVPVTPVSLAALAVLTRGGRLGVDEVPAASQHLRDALEERGAVLLSTGHETDPLVQGLENLEKRGIMRRLEGSWRLNEAERPLAEYYRNAIGQFGI